MKQALRQQNPELPVIRQQPSTEEYLAPEYSAPGGYSVFGVDYARMCRERLARTVAAMERHDIDVLLLFHKVNVNYATGAMTPVSDAGREEHEPLAAVVFRDGSTPYVFTPSPDGCPTSIPPSHQHPSLHLETEDGVKRMMAAVTSLLDPALLKGRIGIDYYTPPAYFLLPELLSGADLVDANVAMREARAVKTRDEVTCLQVCADITEASWEDALAALRPGIRQAELTAIIQRRAFELGATGHYSVPILSVTPLNLRDGPKTTHGQLVFGTPSLDQVLREGDVMLLDAGNEVLGYRSDFGRTWICSKNPKPTDRQKDLYKQWRTVYEAIKEEAKPGRTGGDILRAARKTGVQNAWLRSIWLVHGMGLDINDSPVIGVEGKEEQDENLVLQAGMVMVAEPCVWEDGAGGYRSEEVLLITESGPEQLTHFTFYPFED